MSRFTLLLSLLPPVIAAMPLAHAAEIADAAQDTAMPAPVETFTPPVPISLPDPKYPEISQRLGQEGWVQLTFMVSPSGEPYDVAVIASSGDNRFDTAAVTAVEEWAFEPAQLSGRSIDAGMYYMITFALTDNASASTSFVKIYQRLMKDIQDGNRSGADSRLADLEGRDRNLYEETNLDLARYKYLERWGTPAEQYPPLRRATAMKDGRGFLPDDLLTSLLKYRFTLELKLNRFADARETGSTLLARESDPAVRGKIDTALTQIDALAAGDQPIPVAGRIDGSSHYFHRLLRNRFQLQDIEGDVAELRLHCERNYAGFPFSAGLTYTVTGDPGQCSLRVIGTPGTTFTLVEI